MRRFTPVLMLLAVVSPTALLAQTPWINEFHYDNVSTDTGEFIEVAGAAGIDLADYSLLLYNGSGGATYNTIALSGTLTDESNGFGFSVETLPSNGLQNGSPDGICLINDTSNAVIEFISYEGSFMATNGACNGLTSADVGVAETSGTPVGQSLQLVGTCAGTCPAGLTWMAPSAESPGNVNVGETVPVELQSFSIE